MARRKKKYRKKDKAINLVNAAEGYTQANIATDWLFNLDVPRFLVGTPQDGSIGRPGGHAWGASKVSLMELLTRWNEPHGDSGAPTEFEIVMNNAREGWFTALWKSSATRVGFSVGKKLTAPARRQGNKLLKMFGLRDMVKF